MNFSRVFNPGPRLLRWSVAIVAGLLLLAAFSALLLPGYLKSTLEQQIQTQTGRQFTVDKIAFNPFTLTVNLSQMQLMEADQGKAAFAADNLMLRVSPASLFRLAPVIGAVTLTHPQLRLQRSRRNGVEVTNFSDILARFAQHPSQGEPLRFSVSNIQVLNGDIEFDDRIADKHVQISALHLGLPFISDFPSSVDIFVEPQLSALVNGSKVEIKGRSQPFNEALETEVAIDIDQFNLIGLLAFVPEPLPYKVKSALLTTHLNLNFARSKNNPRIILSGNVSLTDVALADQAGAELFSTKRITATLGDVNLVNRHVALRDLDIIEPHVNVGLNQHGVLNWLPSDAAAKPAPQNTPAATARPLLELARLQIKNGSVHWSDAANATPLMETDIVNINLDAEHLSTDPAAPASAVQLSLAGSQLLKFDGKINPMTAMVAGHLSVSDLALNTYQAYLNRSMAAGVSGRLGLQTELTMQDGMLSLTDLSASIDDLSVQANQHELGALAAKKITLDKLTLNTATHKIALAGLSLEQVQGDLFRDASGQINLMRLMNKPAQSQQVSVSTAKPAAPWQVDVDQFRLLDSRFSFGDKSVQPAVLINASEVNLSVDNVSSTMQQPVKLNLHATLNKTGKFIVDGSASTQAAQLNLDVQNFAVAALQPYFTEFLNIRIDSGSISTKARLGWRADGTMSYQGRVQLANLATADKENSDDFLKWKMLDITGIDVSLGGRQPGITLGNISLNDFYARAILSEQGKLNLQDIMVHPKPAAASADVATQASAQTVSTDVPVVSGSPKAQPVITIGGISLNNGIINYTDNFIRPHYSMRMTGMKGSVGAIRSNEAVSAPINLNGKIDDEAPVAISGSLNPLFNPILLDIKMTANGVNLPRLTAYALKYAGYPIVQGQLSLDVEYHIKDNQLSANNTLNIDQLTFGDWVDGPDATHLPVPFLISLLTDSDGKINLNLPISGTLNDPQFSIGGLIVREFVSLIGKVVTSPFALLTHALGGSGGDELAYIEFDSGSAKLSDASKAKLDTLAKALAQRPALKLDMTGRADLNVDGAGLKAHRLASQIRKTNNLGEEESTDSSITEVQRARAIEKIYSAAKFVKPRNVIGIAKTLPTEEMEKLIIANTVITDDDIRNLALRRESAVRAYLTNIDHVLPERLFSVAPRLSGDGIKDDGAVSRVDFDLKM